MNDVTVEGSSAELVVETVDESKLCPGRVRGRRRTVAGRRKVNFSILGRGRRSPRSGVRPSAVARSIPGRQPWRAAIVLVAVAWIACGAEPPRPASPPPAGPVVSAPPPVAPNDAAPAETWSPPNCGGGALGIQSVWEDIDNISPRWLLTDHALADEGAGVSLQLFGINPIYDRDNPMAFATVHAALTVWDDRGTKRWSRRLGRYDPYGSYGGLVEPRFAITARSVVVAIDARGRVPIDGGDPMFAIEEPGTRGVRHLQLASFSLATGQLEWSRAIELPWLVSMWIREGTLELHAKGRSVRIADEGRGAIAEAAPPPALERHLVERTGVGPDERIWSVKDQKPVSAEKPPARDPRWLVTRTSRAGALHVCRVACPDDADTCGARGMCAEVAGECTATDAGCRASDRCRRHGECSVAENGSCGVLADDDCKESVACKEEGLCIASHGACTRRCPDGEVVCGRTSCEDDCRDDGRCTLRFGTCVPSSDAECRASRACREEGRCYLITRFSPECSALDANDCLRSTGCRERGECSLSGIDGGKRLCVAQTPADCWRSAICRDEGRCTPIQVAMSDHLHCERASDADCRGSRACTDEGRCRLVSGECVR